MNSEAIVARLMGAKTQRDLPLLLQDLGSVDPNLLFKTLFRLQQKDKELTMLP